MTPIVKACHIHSKPESASKDNENMGSYTEKDFKNKEHGHLILTSTMRLLQTIPMVGRNNIFI